MSNENGLPTNNNDTAQSLERQDTWVITTPYLNMAAQIVASQFVEARETAYYESVDAFRSLVEYMMRQHLPIIYSFYFQNPDRTDNYVIPLGTISIIMSHILAERPLFHVVGWKDGR
ncbi:hypothetical protein D3C76_499720 [compost metagenome]